MDSHGHLQKDQAYQPEGPRSFEAQRVGNIGLSRFKHTTPGKRIEVLVIERTVHSSTRQKGQTSLVVFGS